MSPDSPRPFFRLGRAVVFATVCVTLATIGHALVSPVRVPAWAVMVGFAGVLVVAGTLAGHERSLATITGGLLGGQFVLHSLFANASAPVEHHVQTGMAAPADPVPAHGSGLGMTLAHVVAAVISAWWLRRGERTAWALTRRLAAQAGRPVRDLLAVLLAAVEPLALSVRIPMRQATASVGPTGRVLRHEVVRRGPPHRSRALAHS
ncbi:hypothetical protein ACGFNU_05130 [Spirillospora sp. NPDC048911]|uniref:hypothetical protein n=1 Tax=Spirillospora sp. NPDC048911 TaxID=3364527 RepID=UPI00371DB7F9